MQTGPLRIALLFLDQIALLLAKQVKLNEFHTIYKVVKTNLHLTATV